LKITFAARQFHFCSTPAGLCLSVLFLTSSCLSAQSLYVASDLTSENIFTKNIEGPNVDTTGNLYVVNFQRDGTIGWIHQDGSVSLFATLPEGSTGNAIMFDRFGNFLIADFTGHNILKLDRGTKKFSVFCRSDDFNQPNDLTINRKGQLFASDPNWKEKTGKLWRIDPDGKPVLLAADMGTTNGIALSPDEKTLYVNESVQRTIWAFDVDAEDNVSNKRLFYQFPDFGLDGMKTDVAGNLYVARHGKGTIVILSPAGKIRREVQMKGKLTSNLTFGGKDGKTCFVTVQDRKCVEMFRTEVAGRK
jgi:gluconolactonase